MTSKGSGELDQQTETASLVGARGERMVHDLASYLIGRKRFSALGPGFDRTPDGTLRVTVDRESFEALELDR